MEPVTNDRSSHSPLSIVTGYLSGKTGRSGGIDLFGKKRKGLASAELPAEVSQNFVRRHAELRPVDVDLDVG